MHKRHQRSSGAVLGGVFSVLAKPIILGIVSLLAPRTLSRLSQTCRMFRDICGHAWRGSLSNELRRVTTSCVVVDQREWCPEVVGIITAAITQLTPDVKLNWRGMCKYLFRTRRCPKCFKSFCVAANWVDACPCLIHPGEREYIDDCHWGPSGMYWSCCHKKLLDAVGCQRTSHFLSNDVKH